MDVGVRNNLSPYLGGVNEDTPTTHFFHLFGFGLFTFLLGDVFGFFLRQQTLSLLCKEKDESGQFKRGSNLHKKQQSNLEEFLDLKQSDNCYEIIIFEI